MQTVDIEQENKELIKRYRRLLKACKYRIDKNEKRLIRSAFKMAVDAHKDMRRKSGEPYIYHPLEVANIVAEDIGLGPTSIICSLLHDVVEDTDITLEEIEKEFGKKVARIIDGLTKISGIFDYTTTSIQAENFRKLLLTIADDVRVVLIKLADRLHNMRTLDVMPRAKQFKIASETLYIYSPLAHRLGLYMIKTELEDLGMKYTDNEVYKEIAKKLNETKAERNKFIKEFIEPLKVELLNQELDCDLQGRPKSIFSIWNKMKAQNIPFEEVYDKFAIRIIINSQKDQEKADCWKAYSIITDFYQPNPDRLRDWISSPKANGYESLHTTVMSANGKWIEVQIRTQRMDEIAEKGLAAHWKYKGSDSDKSLEEWLAKIRELLKSPEDNALDFVDDFKQNLFAEEVFVFTPNGELKKLPVNSTALDFAFDIHTDIGSKCIGAKINHKLVPLSFKLNNGDQVEIITSKKQKPKEEWLKYVVTAKAKTKIKNILGNEKRMVAQSGKVMLEKKFNQLKVTMNGSNLNILLAYFKVPSTLDLFYKIASEKINLEELNKFIKIGDGLKPPKAEKSKNKTFEELINEVRGKNANDIDLIVGDNLDKIDYQIAACCNPIPGDDVFGFVTVNQGIKIHRVNCPNSIELMSNYAYRIVKAKWSNQNELFFLTGLKITGVDDVGVINKITKVISRELKVNMRAINVDSNDGMFEGSILLFVNDTKHLDVLIEKIKEVKGILTVDRMKPN